MGVIPLQYQAGETAQSLGLTGKEKYSIDLPDDLQPGQLVEVKVSVAMATEYSGFYRFFL